MGSVTVYQLHPRHRCLPEMQANMHQKIRAKGMSLCVAVVFAITQTGNNSVSISSRMKNKLPYVPSREILHSDEKDLSPANATTWKSLICGVKVARYRRVSMERFQVDKAQQQAKLIIGGRNKGSLGEE